FPPQMCFNSPAIQAAVKKRASLIGAEVKKERDALKTAGNEPLFAGVITGWETQIGRGFETDRPLGYRALSHRGFSANNPPRDPDLERVHIVNELMELWANALHAAGVPQEEILCHITFAPQGLDANVSRTGMGGEPAMETCLGRLFHHGAVMVNIFSWGIGGEAMRSNFFRRATENPGALAAYAKFLRHEPLVEAAATGFSSEVLQ